MPRIAATEIIVNGRPIEIEMLDAPTVEDVLVTEMKLQAYYTASRDPAEHSHRVAHAMRDFLVRLGVEY